MKLCINLGVATLCALLIGTVASAQTSQTIRICDASGCSDRPRNSATFDTGIDPNPEETQRLAALADLASKDPRAAYDLGMRYLRGDGVRRDGHLALHWLREAGDQGDLRDQAALGRLYLSGLEEMGSDPAEAERWLALAVERGDKASAPLLAQASEAKKDEQARYRWREHYRKNGYGWWYSAYPYYWVWRVDRWYYR
jgi:uncharacterized protein